MGFTRGVLKDGWKYLALRYTEQAKAITPSQRKQALERFNKEQKRRGLRIPYFDPPEPTDYDQPVEDERVLVRPVAGSGGSVWSGDVVCTDDPFSSMTCFRASCMAVPPQVPDPGGATTCR